MIRRLLLIAPTLIAAVVYSPSLGYRRTLDDVVHVDDPGERNPAPLSRAWTEPYWGRDSSGGLYRPVTTTTFVLENRAGVPLVARHFINVGLHAADTGLVTALAAALGLPAVACALAGTSFALHPVHVEAVAGLVGRAELLAALWLLAALLLHDRRLRRSGTLEAADGWVLPMVAAAFLAFLAAGSKESAWLLPVFALALHGARRRPIRDAWPAFTGYAAGIAAHLLLRRSILGGWLNIPDADVSPFENPLVELHGVERTLGGLRVLGAYLAHLVYPTRLSPDYGGGTIPIAGRGLDPGLLAGLAFLLGALVVAGLASRRREHPESRAFVLGGSWLFTSALVTLNLFLTLETLVADRLLYWPSAAWCLLLGGVLALGLRTARTSPRGGRLGLAGLSVVLILGLAGYTRGLVEYLPVWRDNAALFAYGIQATPRSPLVWSGHGRVLAAEGKIEEALAAYRRIQTEHPRYQSAWGLEAAVLIDNGRFDEARRPLAEALRLGPRDPVARLLEGMLWLEDGRLEEAAARLRECAAKDPRDESAAWHLALALQEMNDTQGAAAAWRKYLTLDPQNPVALNNLAWLLTAELGDPVEGERLARRAVAVDSTIANYRDTLAEALFRQGKAEEAARVARAALTLDVADSTRPDLERFLAPGAADSVASGRSGPGPR